MRPLPTITDRMKHYSAFILPCSFIVLLLLLNIVAIPLPIVSSIEIPFFLMSIYYWSIYRPRLMSPWFLFMAGLYIDLISALPIGSNAIIFLASGWIASRKRRFLMMQPFWAIWVIFCVVCIIAFMGRLCLISVLKGFIFPFESIFLSTLIGGLLFPLIWVMLRLTHKMLPAG